MRASFLIPLLLASCAHGPDPVRVVPSPPPAAIPGCNARLVTLARADATTLELTAVVENTSNEPLELVLPDRCPAGRAEFYGLTDYDFYGTCNAGACVERTTHRIVLGPQQRTSLATVTLPVEGDTCRRPLASGTLELGFGIPASPGVALCPAAPARVELLTARPAPPPEAPRRDCPAIACGGCPGGYAPSRDGCPSCECRVGPSTTVAPRGAAPEGLSPNGGAVGAPRVEEGVSETG